MFPEAAVTQLKMWFCPDVPFAGLVKQESVTTVKRQRGAGDWEETKRVTCTVVLSDFGSDGKASGLPDGDEVAKKEEAEAAATRAKAIELRPAAGEDEDTRKALASAKLRVVRREMAGGLQYRGENKYGKYTGTTKPGRGSTVIIVSLQGNLSAQTPMTLIPELFLLKCGDDVVIPFAVSGQGGEWVGRGGAEGESAVLAGTFAPGPVVLRLAAAVRESKFKDYQICIKGMPDPLEDENTRAAAAADKAAKQKGEAAAAAAKAEQGKSEDQKGETLAAAELDAARQLMQKSVEKGYLALKEVVKNRQGTAAATAATAEIEKLMADPAKKKEIESAAARNEASKLLALTRNYISSGMNDQAREKLQQIIKEYPGTPAAAEAQRMLESLTGK